MRLTEAATPGGPRLVRWR